MSQTILSLAAVFAFSLLGFSMHQHVAQTQETAYIAELENAALDLAVAWTNRVKGYAFDESDVGVLGLRSEGDVDGLTKPKNFGPESSETTPDTFDDLDDFHGYVFRASRQMGSGVAEYDVTFSVQYLDPLDFSVGRDQPTTAKEVQVTVSEVVGGAHRQPVVFTLKVPLTPAKLFLQQ